MKNKKVLILSILIILITIVTGISLSYAYWASIHVSDNTNVLNSGCLNMELMSLNDSIKLERVPSNFFSDDEDVNDSYSFIVTNNCSIPVSYSVDLETLSGSDLDLKYVDANLKGYNLHDYYYNNLNKFKDEIDNLSYNEFKYKFHLDSLFYENIEATEFSPLSEYPLSTPTLDNAIYSNRLYSGTLFEHNSNYFSIRVDMMLGLDFSTDEDDLYDKTWNSKITVTSLPLKTYKVNFDTGYNDVSTSDILVINGEKYGELPELSKDNMVVDYWYLDNDINKKVTSNTIVERNSNHTLKAKWTEGTLLKSNSFLNLNTDKSKIKKIERYSLDFYSLNLDSFSDTSKELSDTYALEIQEDGFNKVYVWLDNDILYYYSDSPVIYFNDYESFGSLLYYGVDDGFSNLETIDLTSFNTSHMISMEAMFRYCLHLKSLDLSNFDTSGVSNMSYMFKRCSELKSLDLSNFDTSKVTDMSEMFSYCEDLEILNTLNFNTSNVTNMRDMFVALRKLNSLDLSNFNTSNVTDMSYMFSGSDFVSIDLSSFDTSNVTKMYSMFAWCNGVTSLDLSNFNTSKVRSMSSMFEDCDSLVYLNISSFDTSNVTYMSEMFYWCKSLTNIDLSSFNTSNVVNMHDMFNNCVNLLSLDLSNFDTKNVIEMSGMFAQCHSLKSLDISNFDTSKVVFDNVHGYSSYCDVFYDTYNLQSVILNCNTTSNFVDYIEKTTPYVPISCPNYHRNNNDANHFL